MGEYVVLCVDDDERILNSLKRLLRQENYKILTATSGAEGLEIMAREMVHLIISDMKMPQMTGEQFLMQVRKTYPSTIRMALSGFADAEMILNAINYGQIYRYIVKPWNDEEVKLIIRQAIEYYNISVKNRELSGITNRQAEQLKQAYKEIQNLNQHLEERVEEQTHELQEAYDNLKRTQAQLLQNEKMASIGQLAAGIAHEINNPIAFVSSNLNTLEDYLSDIRKFHLALDPILRTLEEVEPSHGKNIIDDVDNLKAQFDLDFIMGDLISMIEESQVGTDRVRKIVQDLKDFAHTGGDKPRLADINFGLDKTLQLVWNELKYKVNLNKEYGDLPQVLCRAEQINQVFMNLLVNAGQAIEHDGTISLRTYCDETHVNIEVEDDGCGIDEENLSKIFDAFFTTKAVGDGTGLGLSISYSIIQKHDGEFLVESKLGKGSKFTVRLPIEGVENDDDGTI